MELIVDDRERAVIEHILDLSETYHIKCTVKRLTVGDYAIVYENRVMLIIERKTWEDLASSLRDGRKANINKLINLRTSTNCQIIYLIEGDAYPKPDKMFSRTPCKNLRAHLDHLAFRDNVHMVYAKDAIHTAERLFELARNYSTIKPCPWQDTHIASIDDFSETVVALATMDTNDPIDVMLGNTEQLTIKQESQVSIQEQLLQCLPGIGSIVSTILAENGISIYSIYKEMHTPEQIARYKFASGGSIGMVRANKIVAAKKFIEGKSQLAEKTQINILSAVPLISKQTSEKILAVVSLVDIMTNPNITTVLKDIQRSEKSALGIKAATNIVKYLIPSEEIAPAQVIKTKAKKKSSNINTQVTNLATNISVTKLDAEPTYEIPD